MKIENFSKEVKGALEQRTECTVEEMRIRKNNGVMLYAITLKDDGINIAPTIYLEDYFDNYREYNWSIEQVADKIIEIYNKYRFEHNVNMDFFTNYETAKQRIVYKLINFDRNKYLLEEIPYVRFQDLAIVFYYLVDEDEFSNATILITNRHLDGWGVSTEEIYTVAKENAPKLLKASLLGMMQVLKGLVEENIFTEEEVGDSVLELFEDDNCGMYVLSNSTRLYGAGAILYDDILKEFADKMQSNLFILPSSIHEVIIIPDKDHITKTKLQGMVKEVNETQVAEQEVLSDSVYYFDRNTNKIEIA